MFGEIFWPFLISKLFKLVNVFIVIIKKILVANKLKTEIFQTESLELV